jgi:hypothetical protein
MFQRATLLIATVGSASGTPPRRPDAQIADEV